MYSCPLHRRLSYTETSHRARARFAVEKSDTLTDIHAYDECIRIRQEDSHGAMRAFCSDVRPILVLLFALSPNLIEIFLTALR